MNTKKVLINYLSNLPLNILAKDVFTVEEYAAKNNLTRSAISMTIRRVVLDKTQKWNKYKAFNQNGQIVILETKIKNNKSCQKKTKQKLS